MLQHSKEPSFRESVDLMFNRAVALMKLPAGLEEAHGFVHHRLGHRHLPPQQRGQDLLISRIPQSQHGIPRALQGGQLLRRPAPLAQTEQENRASQPHETQP